jgi:glycerate 2-kinase
MFTKEKEFLVGSYHKIIQEVQAKALYRKYLHLFDNTLYYRNTIIDLISKGKLILAGSGKASLAMGEAILPYLPRKADQTLFISPSEAAEGSLLTIMGDHPIPGKNSLRAGKSMLELISSLDENDTLLYFLSGGSSSLMEHPVEGLTLDDLQSITGLFLAKGMDIHEINALRSLLSKVKAGKLADACKAKCYVFVLSDVMGNDLSIIGSGPFYKDFLDREKISDIIEKYELEKDLPEHIIKILKNSSPESEKNDIPHYLIGSNMDLLEAAELTCLDEGIKPLSFPESLSGEATLSGKMIADMLKHYKGHRPVCMIFGGETTVTLNEKPGLGGRSQELALSVLQELRDTPNIHLLSAGSDGMDGVGGAAGAVVDKDVYKKACSLGLSIQDYLDKHDSYHFHKQCGSLIKTGYSWTNVGDVVMALIDEDS